MTPAERARAWYPTASAGGGNNMAVYNGVGNRFLWKPVSDSNGKAAVHTPSGLRIRSITVAGKEHGFGSYGNGWRPLFRLDKPGAAYGANVAVTMNLHDGRTVVVVVPNGGKRFEKTFAAQDSTGPDLPLPGATPPPAKDVTAIELPSAYAPHARLVVAVLDGKLKACVPGDTSGRKWVLSGRLDSGDFFAVAWKTIPEGLPVVRHALLGAWSYTDRKTWTDDFRTFSQAPAPAPPVTPAPAPTAGLYTRTPRSLTLAPELAAVVRYVDALANVTHGKDSEAVSITPTRAGNTWTLPQDLGSYQRGKLPNTWRIALAKGKSFPAGVTYHTSIAQSFIQETTPPGKFYPPTTRQ